MSNTARLTDARPRAIALTPGEPAGIGPDLAIGLALRRHSRPIVCVASSAMLSARAQALSTNVEIRPVKAIEDAEIVPAGVLQVYDEPTTTNPCAGVLDPANARYVLRCLDIAIDACVADRACALVTGPVQKSLINDAGILFSGHTEYLAERLGAPLPVMMLAAGSLRVALVTTHVPLRAVPDLITAERLLATLEIIHRDLQSDFDIPTPRIAVCGLNPHAGEGGHLGREDQEVIRPVIETLAGRGWNIFGPLPADTAFTEAGRAQADVIVAMFHDQGLSALKALGFGHATNVTLGLPIIRTSVDHGTALDLAATGRIDSGSLDSAMALAMTLSARRCDRH